MATEVHALVLAFDYGYIIPDVIVEMLGRVVDLEAYIDSRTLFNVVAKDGRTAVRGRQIDILAPKESYMRGEMSKIGWLSGDENVADVLTKERLSQNTPLWKIVTTNEIRLNAVVWAI